MSKTKKKAYVKPLTRWTYFTKTLYNQGGDSAEFTYDKVIYYKSEALMDIEDGNKRINGGLLLALFAMFLAATQFQNVWLVIGYFVLVVVGQGVRMMRLPKDIQSHLTDSGRRKK